MKTAKLAICVVATLSLSGCWYHPGNLWHSGGLVYDIIEPLFKDDPPSTEIAECDKDVVEPMGKDPEAMPDIVCG